MQNKANVQAMHWLYSMTNATGFDAINAENALALINAQNTRLRALGAAFSRVKKQRDNAWKALEEARKGLETEKQETRMGGMNYCPVCKQYNVPTEVIRSHYNFDDPNSANEPIYVEICLRCGNEVEKVRGLHLYDV